MPAIEIVLRVGRLKLSEEGGPWQIVHFRLRQRPVRVVVVVQRLARVLDDIYFIE